MKRLVKTLFVLLFLGFLGIGAFIGLFIYISMDLPQINSLKDYNPPMNSKILSKEGEVLLEIGTETRDVVSFKKIPKKVVDAFLAAEDDNFYNHKGIDYLGIIRAFVVNMKEGKLVQGGSTITQQVAKSFLLSKERTISRKIKDLLLAHKIEEKFKKEEILFLYLNQVYLGGGYYGVKAAFRGYFDKSLEEATPAESALVAGLLVAPGRYSPYVNPQFAKVRQNYVLKRMFETKKITLQEYEAALKQDIKMRIRKTNDVKGGHFTDWIRQEVMKSVGVDEFLNNGFIVKTTLDWSLQQKAERIVLTRIKELDKRQGYRGPIKTLDSDEEILSFSTKQRKEILRDQSEYFTFSTEGKNIYEFHEEEEALSKNVNYYLEESEKISERLRSLISIGNSKDDLFWGFLQIGSTYQGVVLEVDDLKRTVLVDIAGSRAIIPSSGFEWAHERKLSEDPVYFNPQKQPSKILKRGDVIQVRIDQKYSTLDQLIHPDFFKKYKDKKIRSLMEKQRFFKLTLDQDPEVEGAMIAIQPFNGEVVTMVGGVDFKKSQFNRVIQSARQPGSAFKPFIYAAALENGYQPTSILMDSPQALGGVDDSLSWKPRNYDGEFKGPMTLRNALEVSRNIPTVRLVQDLGVDKIHEFSKRVGIKAEMPRDMSLSLGSFGISLADLTKGYAIFPNGGRLIKLTAITSIKDRYGKTYKLPSFSQPSEQKSASKVNSSDEIINPFLQSLDETQVYDQRLAYIMTHILRGVTLYGTAAQAGSLGVNIGGKTGTTNNYVDALFVGFSSNLVVGTWAGFDDNKPLGYGETGGKTALPMWIDFMSSAMARTGSGEFSIPAGITQIQIDKETGRKVEGGGFTEAFVEGFDPSSRPVELNQSTTDKPNLQDDDYFMNQ